MVEEYVDVDRVVSNPGGYTTPGCLESVIRSLTAPLPPRSGCVWGGFIKASSRGIRSLVYFVGSLPFGLKLLWYL